MKPTERDLQAQQFADEAGLLPFPTFDSIPEMKPEKAVLTALVWHLARIEARVEGSAQPLKPKYVSDRWAEGVQPTKYPSLVVLGRTATARDASTGVPYQLDGQDVISPDDLWGLWHVGEDVGEGMVHVFASHEPQRNALKNAVEDALQGNVDTLQGLGLPLPEAFLPEPFRSLFEPAAFPRARVSLAGAALPVDDGLAAAGGVWRADVPFTWQAPRIAARSRIPDLAAEVTITVRSSEA